MIPRWLRRHREMPQEAPPLPGKRRRFGDATDIDEFAGELRGIEDQVLAAIGLTAGPDATGSPS